MTVLPRFHQTTLLLVLGCMDRMENGRVSTPEDVNRGRTQQDVCVIYPSTYLNQAASPYPVLVPVIFCHIRRAGYRDTYESSIVYLYGIMGCLYADGD